MQIIDAQIHLWGSGLPGNQAHRQVTSFSAAEAIQLMDEGGVDAAVIHPPPWDPGSHELALAAVRDYPGRFAIMGSPPLDNPETKSGIATWRERPATTAMAVRLPDGGTVTRYGDERRWAERERAFGNDALSFWRWQEATADLLWDLALRSPAWPPRRLAP